MKMEIIVKLVIGIDFRVTNASIKSKDHEQGSVDINRETII